MAKIKLEVLGTIEMGKHDVKSAAELQNWYDNMPPWFNPTSETFSIQVMTALEQFLPPSFQTLLDQRADGHEWIFESYKIVSMIDTDKVQILVQDARTMVEALVEVEVID